LRYITTFGGRHKVIPLLAVGDDTCFHEYNIPFIFPLG